MSVCFNRAAFIALAIVGCGVAVEARAGSTHPHPAKLSERRLEHGFREQDNPAQAGRDIKLYDYEVRRRDLNPARFGHYHPFYAKLLTNEAFFDSIVNRWHLDQPRFEHYHPLLWRVLDGGELERHLLIPAPSDTDSGSSAFGNLVTPPFSSLGPNSPPFTTLRPHSPPSPPTASATPEPSTAALLATGLAALAVYLRSIKRRPSDRQAV